MSNLYVKIHSDTGKENTKTGELAIGADFLYGDANTHKSMVLVDVQYPKEPKRKLFLEKPKITIHVQCEWCEELTNIHDLIKVKVDNGEIAHICRACGKLNEKKINDALGKMVNKEIAEEKGKEIAQEYHEQDVKIGKVIE